MDKFSIVRPLVEFSEAAGWFLGLLFIKSCQEKRISVMLTGGRSAEAFYQELASLSDFSRLSNVDFYFGDERCVQPDNPNSNYGMAVRTLFAKGLPKGCYVHRIEADSKNMEEIANKYSLILPECIDFLLLGVGEDGHIASLFPNSKSMKERQRKVIHVRPPKVDFERITITPLVIQKANTVIVLALGLGKQRVLLKALSEPNSISTYPARLVLRGYWIMDEISSD